MYTADEQTFQGITQWCCKTESQTVQGYRKRWTGFETAIT